MNFGEVYKIIGKIDLDIIDKVQEQINLCITNDDFTYIDHNAQTQEHSWLRVDFGQKPNRTNLIPLYDSLQILVQEFLKLSTPKNYINPVNSISVSLLNPLQTLDEHTDGRFIHRITDRYLIPLMKSEINYNYGYINNEKIIYYLKRGEVYRINNAIVHSAVNLENDKRYNILIDTWEKRLQEKFQSHPDLLKGLTVYGINSKFEQTRKPKVKQL